VGIVGYTSEASLVEMRYLNLHIFSRDISITNGT
jgi:hypothetical protein